ncbi:thioredoxin domain-containing protein [Nitrosophilus alvini]|uniref:thioredoxin domain-containing protein n=1 Tax=Nitrosophilus alvini TaxID=2714855 RepID=UPI00190B98BC|nr:thioredoxin domain-containing protein [Nitrosophilus alvini]
MPNRLVNEDSPYLKQHADNPVDWWPWCEEAFEKALKEKKPIFLSIGYSSCHWCHVMEKEVFENAEIAKFLNEHFISVKVDKEERPDIDKYYQEVYQLLNQRPGGWPTSIFLTHDKKPFFAGTYIPPEPKYNMMGFMQLIEKIASMYKEDPKELIKHAREIERFIKGGAEPVKAVKFDATITKKFIEAAKKHFDKKYGGFSPPPKFPQTSLINMLLNIYRLENDKDALEMAEFTLKNMAKGGIRDLVDGGFCRYSVDDKWLVPHFEKMTYDNALLAETYLKAYFTTKDDFYKNVAFETLDFMLEKMSEKNLFFSSSDADSDNEEGKYYVYKYDEIIKAFKNAGFNDKEIKEVCEKLSITKNGNFEGKIIIRNESLQDFSWLEGVLTVLKELRKNKDYPQIDKKVITSWNAMMIKTLFIASRTDLKYFEPAQEAINALLKKMYIDNHLYHSALIDGEPKIKAFLEDYAYLADALLEAYKTTLNESYLLLAQKLTNEALIEYFDEGRWYFSKGEFTIYAEESDTTYPSSGAKIVSVMLSLGSLIDEKYRHFSFKSLEYYSGKIMKHLLYAGLFAEDIVRLIYEDKIIKSNRDNLFKCTEKIDYVPYPFTLLKADEEAKGYMLCGIRNCYASENDCKKIIEHIKEQHD